MLYLNRDKITEIYVGANKISKVYIGSQLVYSSAPYTGFKYQQNSSGGSIWYTLLGQGTLPNADVQDLIIPDTYNNAPIRRIGTAAFSGKDYIKTVSIPKGIQQIGVQAFWCPNLYYVSYAAENCTIDNAGTGTTACISPNVNWELYIADGVTRVPLGLAQNSTTLEYLRLPETAVCSIDTYAFRNCTKLNNITIPNNIKNIGAFAFNKCSKVTYLGNPVEFYTLITQEQLLMSNGEYLPIFEDGAEVTLKYADYDNSTTNSTVIYPFKDNYAGITHTTAQGNFVGNTSIERFVISRGIQKINLDFASNPKLKELWFSGTYTNANGQLAWVTLKGTGYANFDTVYFAGTEAQWINGGFSKMFKTNVNVVYTTLYT